MSLSVALQADPIAQLDPNFESTLRLAVEAQRRRHELFFYTPERLTYKSGRITARAERLTLHMEQEKFFELGVSERIDLSKLDVILFRQEPPFDMTYLTTTYLLEKLHPSPFVVNHPKHIRDLPEKLFPTLLKDFMPPTLITADMDEIREFRKAYKDIVIKPLYSFSGHAVFRIKPDDDNFQSLLEVLFFNNSEPRMVQPYLPEMKKQECRVVLVDGDYAAIMGRIPAKNETRASLHVGAHYVKAKPTKRHMEICEALGPMLKKKQLIFTGIDVIGDYLTEINITSPGSLAYITKLYGKRLEVDIWDAIENYI